MIADATWEKPHTFEEAVQYLKEDHGIDYEVKIDRHHGALMTRESWLESVESGFFTDYDGMGDQVSATGTIIKGLRDLKENRNVGGWIYPSEAHLLSEACSYILWYNK